MKSASIVLGVVGLLGTCAAGSSAGGTPSGAQQSEQEIRQSKSRIRRAASSAQSDWATPTFAKLCRPDLAAEFGLTEDQARTLRTLEKLAREAKVRSISAELTILDVPPPFHQARLAQLQAPHVSIISECEHIVMEAVLDETQRLRVLQLEWRVQGIHAVVNDKELAARLGISRHQSAALKLAYAGAMDVLRNPPPEMVLAMMPSTDPPVVDEAGQTAVQAMKARNQEAEAKVWAVLSARQRAKWKELVGAPPRKRTSD